MWNEFSQFICTSTKVIPVEKTQIGCILMMSQGLKKSFKRGTNNPTSDLSKIFKKKLGIPAQTLINSIQCKTFVVVMEIKSNLRRKKIHRTNHGPNFNRGSFSNRDNIRTPTLFRGEGQSQHFKRLFFLKRQTHPSRHQCHRKGQLKEADFSYQYFLHHSSLSCRSDSSLGAKSRSGANFIFYHKSEACSYFNQRIVSAQTAILQIASLGRSLVDSMKTAGPRMKP